MLCLLVLVSCGTHSAKTIPTETITKAIDEVKKPDSYYLVKCKKPRESKSDLLPDVLELIRETLEDNADCHNRHNGLIPQVQ